MLALTTAAVLVSGGVAELRTAPVRVDAGVQLVGRVAAVGALAGTHSWAGARVRVVVTGGVSVASTDRAAGCGAVVSVTVDTGVGGVGDTARVGAVGAFRGRRAGVVVVTRSHGVLDLVDNGRHDG